MVQKKEAKTAMSKRESGALKTGSASSLQPHDWPSLEPKTLFFCSGMPKSGTTFLQRMLDMHPEVSCPPEHQFRSLSMKIRLALKEYDEILGTIDERLGGTGLEPHAGTLHPRLLKEAVLTMIWRSAGSKRIAGANDNISIMERFGFYNRLFGQPRFIIIFRNPIDIALSSWHANQALAEEFDDEKHLDLMRQHGDFDDWVRYITKAYGARTRQLIAVRQASRKIYFVRYEDLVLEKKAQLAPLFRFLGAFVDGSILDRIVEQSDFTAMREASTRKSFFRSGSLAMGGDEVSASLRAELRDLAPEAEQLGYDLVNAKLLSFPLSGTAKKAPASGGVT